MSQRAENLGTLPDAFLESRIAGGEARVCVVSHRHNKGLGPAFNRGVDAVLAAGADVIVTPDGDGQHPPEEMPRLLAPLLGGRAEFVTATRFGLPARGARWRPCCTTRSSSTASPSDGQSRASQRRPVALLSCPRGSARRPVHGGHWAA